VLIISMIFVLVFSALAVSMATMSGTNVQIADNQRKANRTRACAESGLEIIRFWLNRISISGLTEPSEVFNQIAASLQNDLEQNGIVNITPTCQNLMITIPSVILNSAKEQNFCAQIKPLDANTLQLNVTGIYGSLTKTISVNYEFGTRLHTVFDYGVVTKGPLHLAGNTELDGINIAGESDIYIESDVTDETLSIIGNSQIAGDVSFTSTEPDIELGGCASIGGEVSTGVPPAEFPAPNPDYFTKYTTDTDIVDSTTDTSADMTLENVRIVAGTNPVFSGHVTLKGIVFIETPNVVTFAGGVDIIGIIVGDGNIEDNSGTNQINFVGNVHSLPVTQLPDDEKFAAIKNETGTFLMAPGFSVSFGGNFHTLNGAIAANGIEFSGNAGGTIDGSVINYSDEPMTLSGNSDLYFNRSGTTEMPAGFVPEIVLNYVPASYSEIML